MHLSVQQFAIWFYDICLVISELALFFHKIKYEIHVVLSATAGFEVFVINYQQHFT